MPNSWRDHGRRAGARGSWAQLQDGEQAQLGPRQQEQLKPWRTGATRLRETDAQYAVRFGAWRGLAQRTEAARRLAWRTTSATRLREDGAQV
jgi:hypothetical protein